MIICHVTNDYLSLSIRLKGKSLRLNHGPSINRSLFFLMLVIIFSYFHQVFTWR